MNHGVIPHRSRLKGYMAFSLFKLLAISHCGWCCPYIPCAQTLATALDSLDCSPGCTGRIMAAASISLLQATWPLATSLLRQ